MDVEARIYLPEKPLENVWGYACLLYKSDAADERPSRGLGRDLFIVHNKNSGLENS